MSFSARLGFWPFSSLLSVFVMSVLSCNSGALSSVGVDVRCVFDGRPERRRVVEVEFWKSGDCFIVPEGTRVALNGQLLQLVSLGARRAQSSEFRNPKAVQPGISAPNCEPALFRSQALVPTPARLDQIVVQMSGDSGTIEIEGLLAERTLSISSGPVQRGKPVTLEWAPRSDVWPTRIIGAEVKIVEADGKATLIAGSALRMEPGRFQFELPNVAPGRVAISVNPGATSPYAPVKSCRGFHECVSREASWPYPLEVEVVATPPRAPDR